MFDQEPVIRTVPGFSSTATYVIRGTGQLQIGYYVGLATLDLWNVSRMDSDTKASCSHLRPLREGDSEPVHDPAALEEARARLGLLRLKAARVVADDPGGAYEWTDAGEADMRAVVRAASHSQTRALEQMEASPAAH